MKMQALLIISIVALLVSFCPRAISSAAIKPNRTPQARSSKGAPFIFPDDPVPKDSIRVTTLGSGSPDVKKAQVASGFLIQVGNGDNFIFDLGSGSYINLLATGVPQATLTRVFLSHLHSDHIADLASLYVGAIFGRTEPWEVWGPSGERPDLGTSAAINGLRQFLAWDTHARHRIDMIDRKDRGDQVVVHEFDHSVKKQIIYDRNGVRVISTPVKHYETPGPVALRLEWNGLSVTYSGDMKPNLEFEELAQDTDVVIFQNMGPIENGDVSALPFSSQYLINTSHVTPEQSGPILDRINPRLAVLHHLLVNDASREAIVSAVRTGGYRGDLAINEDLDVFEISSEWVKRQKLIVPDRSWGYWHAESNTHHGVKVEKEEEQ